MNLFKSKILCVNSSILNKIVSTLNKTPSFKTWSRSALISSDFVGLKLRVHNGKEFVPLNVLPEMVGYRLGEFVSTRAKYEFKKKKKKK